MFDGVPTLSDPVEDGVVLFLAAAALRGQATARIVDRSGQLLARAVHVDMNTPDAHALSSWARGIAEIVMAPDITTLRHEPCQPGSVLLGPVRSGTELPEREANLVIRTRRFG